MSDCLFQKFIMSVIWEDTRIEYRVQCS